MSAVLLVAVSVLLPQPAFAAPVTTVIGGIMFTADNSNIPAGATVIGYTPGGTDVVIPATVMIAGNTYDVTAIVNAAFDSKGLTSVVIPNTVSTIGHSTFRNNALTSVTL